MNYRRLYIDGSMYFFTVVTYQRTPVFAQEKNVSILREAFHHVKSKHPFKLDAISILPDHIHCIWEMSEGDCDYSMRWNLIKGFVSRRINNRASTKNSIYRFNKRESAIWQRRFWEHQIRNERDYEQHLNYIHYNPVKHGLAKSPYEWPHSSFRKFIANNVYSKNWGAHREISFSDNIGRE